MQSRFSFFFRYYPKKVFGTLLGCPPTEQDHFLKRYHRMHHKLQGRLIEEKNGQLQYQLSHQHFFIRTAGSSDIQVFRQIFEAGEYRPLVEEIEKHGASDQIQFIIDAGANVGFTSLFLNRFFPQAMIVAVEPDASNLSQLEKNFQINGLKNYHIIRGGLWWRDAWLRLKSPASDQKEWAFFVEEAESETGLRGYSLQSILKNFELPSVDILKIDIEGAEKFLFEDEGIKAILAKTKFLAMEIHDNIASRRQIENLLTAAGFRWFNHGELTIASNQSLLRKNFEAKE